VAWGQSTISLPLHMGPPVVQRPRTRKIRRSRLDLQSEAEAQPEDALGSAGSDGKEDEEAIISIGVDLGTT